jgi:hypothetical protein
MCTTCGIAVVYIGSGTSGKPEETIDLMTFGPEVLDLTGGSSGEVSETRSSSDAGLRGGDQSSSDAEKSEESDTGSSDAETESGSTTEEDNISEWDESGSETEEETVTDSERDTAWPASPPLPPGKPLVAIRAKCLYKQTSWDLLPAEDDDINEDLYAKTMFASKFTCTLKWFAEQLFAYDIAILCDSRRERLIAKKLEHYDEHRTTLDQLEGVVSYFGEGTAPAGSISHTKFDCNTFEATVAGDMALPKTKTAAVVPMATTTPPSKKDEARAKAIADAIDASGNNIEGALLGFGLGAAHSDDEPDDEEWD